MSVTNTPLRLAADSQARLNSIIEGLKGYRTLLEASSDHESVGLLSIVILQLEMRAHRVEELELEELCNAAQARLGRNASRATNRTVSRNSDTRPPNLKVVD